MRFPALFPIALSLIALLSRCGGTVLVTGNIINLSTSNTLEVTYNGQKTTVLPQSIYAIHYLAAIKTGNAKRERKNFDCCPCRQSGQLTIIPSNGKKLTKDLSDRNNWKIVHDGKDIACDFEVSDTDLK
jgi:hypothetical protein